MQYDHNNTILIIRNFIRQVQKIQTLASNMILHMLEYHRMDIYNPLIIVTRGLSAADDCY